jgi:hypothetical protein
MRYNNINSTSRRGPWPQSLVRLLLVPAGQQHSRQGSLLSLSLPQHCRLVMVCNQAMQAFRPCIPMLAGHGCSYTATMLLGRGDLASGRCWLD